MTLYQTLTAILVLVVASAPAQLPVDEPLALPNDFGPVFRTGAVLQRDCDLPVWGTAAPRASVAVFLDAAIVQTTADAQGRWRVVFPPQKPGCGHHLALVVNGRPAAVVEDIAIGDVWFCAGTEEMSMSFFSGVENAEKELEDTDLPDLRLFYASCDLAIGPQTTIAGDWRTCDFNNARAFSALGFLFGRRLLKDLDVPIGVIRCVKDRTPMMSWLPLEAAGKIDPEAVAARRNAIRAWVAGGEGAFDLAVQEWESSYDGADPYENADILPSDTDFEEDGRWISTEVPTTIEKPLDSPDFDGVVWFRRTVFLTAEQAAKKATLYLGSIDDEDTAWINGGQIGETKGPYHKRAYRIPDGALHAGSNLIAVRVLDQGGLGAFGDTSDRPAIRFDDDTSVDLSEGLWTCRAKKAPKGPRPKKTMLAEDALGICFDSLVNPFAGMAVRGFVWGGVPVDADTMEGYGAVLEELVKGWRDCFVAMDGGDIPFFLIQPASYGNTHSEPVESALAAIRDAQMELAGKLPGVFVTVTIDDGARWGALSPRKRIAADRLADIALAAVYGKEGIVAGSPRAEAAAVKGTQVVVEFRGALPLRASDDGAVRGFQLAAADGAFAWAKAEVVDGGVAVAVPDGMKSPAKIRYAWDDYPDCNLVGSNGHPVGSFELAIAP